MLVTVRLLGKLAKKFGSQFVLDIDTAREAIFGINANSPGFAQYLLDTEQQGIGYRIYTGSADLREEQLELCVSDGTLWIIPAVLGGGGRLGGLFQVLAGGALLGIGLAFPGFTPVALLGASLILQGVAGLLTPTPENEGNENDYFSGNPNTVGQGAPVRIAFGRVLVGSLPIGGSISLEDEEVIA